MWRVAKWFIVGVVGVHGVVHLLGAVNGFGWAQVPQLSHPATVAAGLAWLGAAILLLLSAGMVAAQAPDWWWVVAGSAVVASQVMIVTAWDDAKAGTAVNVVLALVAVYGFVSAGPLSVWAQWRAEANSALADVPVTARVVTREDLDRLPAPLADYVRRSGALNRPAISSLRARMHGRIRSGPDASWMRFTATQVSTFGPCPQRIFLMQARRGGLPVEVLHTYTRAGARMHGSVLSLATVIDASGPELRRAETVTVFNDLVVLAPGAIVFAPVRWQAVDDRRVRGTMTVNGVSVSATLVFDAAHDLVDFVSDDRLRAIENGARFVPQRWSTPVRAYALTGPGGRRLASYGEGRWHAPAPEGDFSYVEFTVDDISYGGDAPIGTQPHRMMFTGFR
jgi:hypothetical protein